MASFKLPDTTGRSVVVLGGGVLGRRIAACWAAGGHEVRVRDPSAEQRAAAVKYVEDSYALYAPNIPVAVKPGTVTAFEDLGKAVENAWLVIEAVPELLPLKISTFADLEKLAPKDALLCSNSSSYKSREMIDGLQEATKKRISNQHYYMPPHVRIVELMTCSFTDESIFPFMTEKLRAVGLHPYTARKESTGLIFNRLWAAIKRESLNILAEGVSVPEEVDQMWVEGLAKSSGPMRSMDSVGLDTVSFIEQHYVKERHLPDTPVKFLQKYIDEGRLGKKSPKGGLYPPSHTTQSADGKDAPLLYFLDVGLNDPNFSNIMHGGRIVLGHPDGRAIRQLATGQVMPDGIDISVSAGKMFWTSMGIPSANDGSILSANLDGSDIKTIVAPGKVHTPKQLVVDEKNNKLYYADREGMRVFRCDFDGSNIETLVQAADWKDGDAKAKQTNWCVGVAVSPATGKFFWTQKGYSKSNKGRIFCANIDFKKGETAATRTDIETIFQGLPEPIDLEVDEKGKMLYWTDRGELPLGNSINRVSFDKMKPVEGTAPSLPGKNYELLVRNLHEAIGLKLDIKNGHMYATDLGGTLYRFDLDGGKRKKIYENLGSFTGISLVYP
ncbi:hypothetical protein CDD81_695 [Ophiocordyceps australis]|uniref:3-hydroxyacyl-CoA dehydrogenase NAD binding domain-containing protein n=1 Tax=Ophiocordyceps australis TaxID=1399860 RepID=A0A2C5Y1R6_9HYPO|nr:hypothetical protein CDD81_695 [Ophiocordyceps australis]